MKKVLNKNSFVIMLLMCLTFNLFCGAVLKHPIKVSAETVTYMRGVNMAGPEFSSGTYWPSKELYDYYAAKGFNVFRVPIKWERIQPSLNGALDTIYLNGLKTQISYAKANGTQIIIDVHNYGRYYNKVINGEGSNVKTEHLCDLWVKLSNEFKNESGVYAYDIMNEPHDMQTATLTSAENWRAISNAVVNAIRANGDTKLILVEGNSWSNAAEWEKKNATPTDKGSWINDPANNFIYSAHSYWDQYANGLYEDTYDEELARNPGLPTLGMKRVMYFIDWCLKNNVRGHIGEFGVPSTDPRWNIVLENFYKCIDEYGFDATYWAAGSFNPERYPLCCNPTNGVDAPQMSVMEKHLSKTIHFPSGSTVRYEAEDGIMENGAARIADPNSSNGYVAGNMNAVGASVTIHVDGGDGGLTKLRMHYASGYSQFSIYVNGVHIKDQWLKTSGGNYVYDDTFAYVTLKPGMNTIKFQRDDSPDGSFKLDYIEVTTNGIVTPPAPTPTPTPEEIIKYECEDLVTTTSGVEESDFSDSKCSGGKGNKLEAQGVNDYVEYEVYIPSAGTWNISMRVKKHDSRGKFRLYLPQSGKYVGGEYDQYSAKNSYDTIDIGSYQFKSSGVKKFRFIVTGKNPNSKGYTLGNYAIIISK